MNLPLFGLVRRIRHRLEGYRVRLMENMAFRFAFAMAHRLGRDDVSTTAAGIAYYALLSLFPLLLGLIAIFGLFLPSQSVQQQVIRFLAQYLPGSVDFLQENIAGIIRVRGALGIVSIIGLFWAGSGVFSAISQAINKAWDIEHRHPFYIKKPRELGMALATGFLFLLSLGASTLLSFLGDMDLPSSALLVNIGTVLIAAIFSLLIFAVLYKSMPVTWVSWRYVLPGAVLATVLFEVAKTVFIFFLNNYGSYDKIYGSIASVIILLVWIFYSAFILVLGAEFSAMLSRLRRGGSHVLEE